MILYVQTSDEGQRAHALSASLSLSLPTKAVHTMVFQGTSAPSIPYHPPSNPPAFPPSPYDSRKHPPRPLNPQPPPPTAMSRAACLFSPQPLLSWPAHHDVTGPFDGLLEEAYLRYLPNCSPVTIYRQDSSKLVMRHARAGATLLHTREDSTEDDWTLDTFLVYG